MNMAKMEELQSNKTGLGMSITGVDISRSWSWLVLTTKFHVFIFTYLVGSQQQQSVTDELQQAYAQPYEGAQSVTCRRQQHLCSSLLK